MIWMLFALLHVFASSGANILRKVLMRDDKSDPVASAIVFQLATALLFLLIALVKGFIMPPVLHYFGNFMLSCVCYGLGTICIFKALKYIEASEATIISSFDAVVTIFTAILFLGDQFNLQKMLGTALIIIPVIVISYQKKMVFNRGVFYALGMAIFYGIAVTNDAYLLKFSDPISFLFIGFLFPGLFLLLIQPQATKHIPYYFHKKAFRNMFFYVVAYAIAAIGFYFALVTGGHASQLAPITQSTIIVTVILSALFLHETHHLIKKIILAVTVAIGVVLLA